MFGNRSNTNIGLGTGRISCELAVLLAEFFDFLNQGSIGFRNSLPKRLGVTQLDYARDVRCSGSVKQQAQYLNNVARLVMAERPSGAVNFIRRLNPTRTRIQQQLQALNGGSVSIGGARIGPYVVGSPTTD